MSEEKQKRNRRSKEQIIADMERELALKKAMIENPEFKPFLGAINKCQSAHKVAKEQDNEILVNALEKALSVLSQASKGLSV